MMRWYPAEDCGLRTSGLLVPCQRLLVVAIKINDMGTEGGPVTRPEFREMRAFELHSLGDVSSADGANGGCLEVYERTPPSRQLVSCKE
jgi:hypothetical protein